MPISNFFDPRHFNPKCPKVTEEYVKKVWGKKPDKTALKQEKKLTAKQSEKRKPS